MKNRPLIRALSRLFPEADFHIAEARDWRSMTFSGQQLAICCNPKSCALSEFQDRLSAILPEYEFTIPGLLVADISIVTSQKGEPSSIEVLVISE